MTKVKNNVDIPQQSFVDKCYKDKQGRVVLGQKPNVPIIVWAVCRFALLFVKNTESMSTLYTALDIISFGALFTWTWLELFDGTTYMRRLLGLSVLFVIIFSRVYA